MTNWGRRAGFRIAIVLSVLFAGIGSLLPARPAMAQAYPTKPVHFIIGQPPGGSTDTFGRAIAEGLAKLWGQPAIVENKPGANTIIAAEYVAKSAPDGHTIWVAGDVGLMHNLFMYSKLPYDPRKDFALITRLVEVHQVFVVPSQMPVSNIREFVALMKKDGAKYNYASPGIGDPGHINFEWFKQVAGFEMMHIPYKGTPPALQALLAGDAHAFVASVPSTEQFVRTGKIKPIAISGSIRSRFYPDVESLNEAGYPNVQFSFWLALVTSAGTPPEVVRKIAADVRRVMTTPEFRGKYVDPFEFRLVADTPEEFAAFHRAAIVEAEQKVKASGAKLD